MKNLPLFHFRIYEDSARDKISADAMEVDANSESESSRSSKNQSDDEEYDLENCLASSTWESEETGYVLTSSQDCVNTQENDLPEETSKLFKELSSNDSAPKLTGGARHHVSPFAIGLIGQANMSWVRRNHEEAMRLCKEIILFDRNLPDPYRIMSEIYEEREEHEMALQLGIICAMTSFRDTDLWVSMGNKAMDLNRTQDALFCFYKAVKLNPQLFETYLTIIALLNPTKDRKAIIQVYQKLIKLCPIGLGEKITEWAREGASICHSDHDLKSALNLMEEAFQRVPDKVTHNDVNLIVELHVQLHQYRQALEVIVKYCDVYVEGEEDEVAEDGQEGTTVVFRVTDCRIGVGDIPLQIRGKLAVILIHLKAFSLMDTVIAPLFVVIEEYGDVLIEIAEALMAENRHVDALKVLKLLVSSMNFNAAQVWYLYGQCLRILNRKEEAVSAFSVVMEQAPQHAEARLIVSVLLNELGRGEEALDALTQDPNSGYIDVGMLFERCLLLKDNPERSNEFLVVGRLLLSRHCARFRNRSEYVNFVRSWGVKKRNDMLRKFKEENEEVPMYVEGKRMPTADEEFELFLALCRKAFETKQFALLQRLTSSALGSLIICKNKEKEDMCLNLVALAIYLNNDCYGAINFYRNLIGHGLDSTRIWNLFSLLACQLADNRWQRYIQRLLAKRPEHFALATIYANNCFSSGSYKQAISEYLLLFKHNQTPLLALLIAITFMHLALQKFNLNLNVVVNQAIGFLSQYKELRGGGICEQEVHYNMARLHHQLGLYPNAIFHYKQVLNIEAEEPFDLKMEAAYNLSRIYIASKSFNLARYYVEKYIVI